MDNAITTQDNKLISVFEDIKKNIEVLDSIQDLKSLRDTAAGFEAAWKAHYKSSHDGFEMMFKGWEAKVRSERRMGELLRGMEKQAGARTPTGLRDETPLLDDLGISKTQSYRYQLLTRIPTDQFDALITTLYGSFMEPATKMILKLLEQSEPGESLEAEAEHTCPNCGFKF